jgi:hypothetical protein
LPRRYFLVGNFFSRFPNVPLSKPHRPQIIKFIPDGSETPAAVFFSQIFYEKILSPGLSGRFFPQSGKKRQSFIK